MYFNPLKRVFLNLSGGTVTGDTIFNENLYAAYFSGGTIFSGNSDLANVIYEISTTIVTGNTSTINLQPGLNTYTGGTVTAPTINISAATLSYLNATTISGGTIYSGSTPLETVITNIANALELNDVTRVQPGLNIYTGGTANNPTINISAATLTYLSATTISGGTIYSGGTDLYNIFQTIGSVSTRVQPGSNIITGGTTALPIISIVSSPSFDNISFSGIVFGGALSASSLSASSLTNTRVLFAGTNGLITDNSNFTFNSGTNTLNSKYIIIGTPGQTGTTLTVHGDVLVIGEAISGFTSELFIEDNLIELNYNPTASTTSTSLGAGFSIQDGSGSVGTDVFFDIRGASAGIANRGFATNLNDIYIRESGTTSSPGGVRVIAENDELYGGSF